MGFLKNFFSNVFHEGAESEFNNHSSFDHLTEEQLEAHLGVAQYGEFVRTASVRTTRSPIGWCIASTFTVSPRSSSGCWDSRFSSS